jgi:hypothetical protein
MSDHQVPSVVILPEYAACIAEAANRWAWVELEVHWMLWSLLEVNPTLGACLTAQIYSFNAKLDALLSIMKLRNVPRSLIDRVNKFTQTHREALESRNRFVHDVWLKDNLNPDAMGRSTMSARRKLDFRTETVSVESLKDDMATISRSQETITAIRKDVIDALPTLPKIPHEALHPLSDIR